MEKTFQQLHAAKEHNTKIPKRNSLPKRNSWTLTAHCEMVPFVIACTF